MPRVAVHGKTLSGRKIAEAMGATFFRAGDVRDEEYRGEYSHIINFGWCYPDPPDQAKVLNEHLIANKLTQLRKMKEAGVSVPRHSERVPHDQRTKWLGRAFRHAMANDLRRPLANPDYYVEFIPKKREFRVHVINGLVVRMNEKLLRNPDAIADIVWNSRNCRFSAAIIEPERLKLDLRTIGKAAVAALNYDFGAVDVIWHPERGLFALEVNAAPTLIDNQNTLGRYVEHFRAWLERA